MDVRLREINKQAEELVRKLDHKDPVSLGALLIYSGSYLLLPSADPDLRKELAHITKIVYQILDPHDSLSQT